jgi:hypothetical protein
MSNFISNEKAFLDDQINYLERLGAFLDRQFGDGALTEEDLGWLSKTAGLYEDGDPNADQNVKTSSENTWQDLIDRTYSE